MNFFKNFNNIPSIVLDAIRLQRQTLPEKSLGADAVFGQPIPDFKLLLVDYNSIFGFDLEIGTVLSSMENSGASDVRAPQQSARRSAIQ